MHSEVKKLSGDSMRLLLGELISFVPKTLPSRESPPQAAAKAYASCTSRSTPSSFGELLSFSGFLPEPAK
jgi:hypothetical protein